MSNDDSTVFITRREFYSALAIVWAYIWLLLGDQLRIDEGRWSVWALWGAALLMMVAYSWQANRAARSLKTAGRQDGGEDAEEEGRVSG
jgi:hypothetical protein